MTHFEMIKGRVGLNYYKINGFRLLVNNVVYNSYCSKEIKNKAL